MKVADLLHKRHANWQELDTLCRELEWRRAARMSPAMLARFAALYRAACADLALAEAYQLPPGTVTYLHRLVGRAHNQLYRSRRFDVSRWTHELLVRVPQQILRDRCVWLAHFIFWGTFIFSMFLAGEHSLLGSGPILPGYAEELLGRETIEYLREGFAEPFDGRDGDTNAMMAAFYIFHNTGIGLKCFAAGLLLGVGGLFMTFYNAAFLGAAFGYMTRPDIGETHFFEFVTAHGPFELTAIVLSAAAGMRLGFALVHPEGYRRVEALRRALYEAFPVMCAAMVMFGMAALIEGFISPSGLPYAIKAAVAVLSIGLLLFYFFVLGWPRHDAAATG